MQIPNIFEVLSLLVSGVASGFVLSFLAEKTTLFQKLSSQAKTWVVLGISIGLPVIGQVLIQFVPPSFWEAVQPYWQALATGFVVWMGSQYAYTKLVRPESERVSINHAIGLQLEQEAKRRAAVTITNNLHKQITGEERCCHGEE